MKPTIFISLGSLALALPMAVQGFMTPSGQWHSTIRHQPISLVSDIAAPSSSVGWDMRHGSSSSCSGTNRKSMQLNLQKTESLPTKSKSTGPPPPSLPSKSDGGGINVGLITQSLANQLLIGLTIWTGGLGYRVLTQHADFTPIAAVLGVIGLVPLLAISRTIETSESYLVSGLNLSTNMAVLRLFGPNPQPVLALLISTVLAGVTGLVEETTFRGQLSVEFANRFGDGNILMGAVLSTMLFAVLHTNPLSFFKGGDAALDNGVLLALQLVNGAIFALLYFISGNLAVPIVAHALYDLYTFYKTHMVDVAGQMEYAKQQGSLLLPKVSKKLEEKWIAERGPDFVNGVKQSFYLMDTNRNGVLDRKELRIALYSYGINLSKVESELVTAKADLDGSGSIDLDEFLEFVGPTGSARKAASNTLLGPRQIYE
jgi:membrane protease YdiL (CAAX protease family)